MVKEGKGCNIRVECLGIAKVTNPRVVHNSLDEDLDAMLSGLISLVVLNHGGPGSFGANAVDARSFHADVRVIARRTGGWAYKGSAIVVKIPVHAGNESPEVVDTIDAVVGGLEKDRQDGVGEMDKIIVGGLSINGEEERLGCCEG
jgi:hypothetical protein